MPKAALELVDSVGFLMVSVYCTGNGESGTRQNCPHVGCNRLHLLTGAVASGAIPGRHENDWCSSATRGAVHW